MCNNDEREKFTSGRYDNDDGLEPVVAKINDGHPSQSPAEGAGHPGSVDCLGDKISPPSISSDLYELGIGEVRELLGVYELPTEEEESKLRVSVSGKITPWIWIAGLD